jgi:predicted O-methyltransferase YrrM
MKRLQEIWDDLPMKSDKGSVHSYFLVYEEILSPYRTGGKNILEIGLFNGASMIMWEKYFDGTVWGIDCSNQPHDGLADLRPLLAEGIHNICIGDAENASDVDFFFKGISFDVVLEDAGHHLSQQLKIYETIKPYLNKGAIYIIEDIQDIDATRTAFENIDPEKEIVIVDLRSIKNRYDDVLVIITDKK